MQLRISTGRIYWKLSECVINGTSVSSRQKQKDLDEPGMCRDSKCEEHGPMGTVARNAVLRPPEAGNARETGPPPDYSRKHSLVTLNFWSPEL